MSDKRIHITFDYELFFGASSGTVQRCMIDPTNRLLEIANKQNVRLVFFVDAGFIWQLNNFKNNSQCQSDLNAISTQLKQMISYGHEVALHVHPHWEDSKYENGAWNINTTRYKLSDFSESEAASIISKYHQVITDITGVPCHSFRAGGWCLQPFTNIRSALKTNQIYFDSSVYRNGFHQFTAQSYDYRNAPDKTEWKFELNECMEDPNGSFTEVAITPDRISPFFYFSLYFKMKSDPANFKPMGDGMWLKDKKKIYKQFYSATDHFACCDGYFASRLISVLSALEKAGKKRMVVLGHPKSMAECSFTYLDNFIYFAKQKGYQVTGIHEDFKK